MGETSPIRLKRAPGSRLRHKLKFRIRPILTPPSPRPRPLTKSRIRPTNTVSAPQPTTRLFKTNFKIDVSRRFINKLHCMADEGTNDLLTSVSNTSCRHNKADVGGEMTRGRCRFAIIPLFSERRRCNSSFFVYSRRFNINSVFEVVVVVVVRVGEATFPLSILNNQL